MSLARILLSLIMLSYSNQLLAQRKEVREVETNDRLMKVVHLTLGRSTVLSFQEKPIKIISGNSNYFNIEFIGNDLTLQPLAQVETNLFVYTEKGTKYGFLLKVGTLAIYDDIVYIKWQSQRMMEVKKVKPQKMLQPFKLILKNGLEIRVMFFSRLAEMKTYLVDFEVFNSGSDKIKMSSIDIFASRSGQRFIGQKIVWEKDQINSGQKSKARLIVRIDQAQDFSFNVIVDEKEVRSIITKDYL